MNMSTIISGLIGGLVPTILGIISIAFMYGRLMERLENHINDKDIHAGHRQISQDFMPRKEQEQRFDSIAAQIREVLKRLDVRS